MVTCSAAFAGGLEYLSGKFLRRTEEQPAAEAVVLQKEEFEPTVFLLCAENEMVKTPLFLFNIDLIFFKNLSSVVFCSVRNCCVTALSPPQALNQAKQRICDLILAEHAVKIIKDQYISQLSQADMDDISTLQKQLTVSISLEKGGWDQEPFIRLEGLTRDVFTADAELRSASQSQQNEEMGSTRAS